MALTSVKAPKTLGKTKHFPAQRKIAAKSKVITRVQPTYLSSRAKKVRVIK